MKPELETLLGKWREGDKAAGEQVVEIVYADLWKLAAYFLSHERPGHTLLPTDLVNEAYLRLTSGKPVNPRNRTHFIALAARQMRRVLIDHARRQKALKRNDTMMTLALFEGQHGPKSHIESVLAVEEILQEFELLEPRAAQVVEYRVFGGLTEKDIAELLDLSVPTIKRDWTFARAWLIRKLRPDQRFTDSSTQATV